ncbi:MAG: hypothetical protein ACOCVN_02645, partial [bacterium]
MYETNQFYKNVALELVWNAEVKITSPQKTYHLVNILNTPNDGFMYNYTSSENLALSDWYHLQIITTNGDTLISTT